MGKSAKVAWGIDVGNSSLKALKLSSTDDGVEVLDYAVLKHEKILSQPDVDPQQRSELIQKAIQQFMSQHDVGGVPVVVAVPGHSSFARFIKLPPVESKRIHDIVRFEAIQQIPFDIEDVEWDWQSFASETDPEVEVGIFAIKKELVQKSIEAFTESKCPVHIVQMAPMALYNFLHFDQHRFRKTAPGEATILLDIGAENTDLVIADGRRVWQRSIPIGGNQFTAAVQKAFKLSFSKAEAIKRTASTSKYARQIFQAMRSVFADMAAEIQRSLGFYSSGNRTIQFREVLALGSALRLPGLTKFLQQSLSLPIKRLDSFESLTLSPDVSVAQFTESLPSLALAYGLSLQGLGQAAIVSNLLPLEVARRSQWQRKRRWFIAASTIFLLGAIFFMYDAYAERGRIQSPKTRNHLSEIDKVDRDIKQRRRDKDSFANQITSAQSRIATHAKVYQESLQGIAKRALVQHLYRAVLECLPNPDNTQDQALLFTSYQNGDVDEVLEIPREERKQIFLNQFHLIYTDDLNKEFNDVIGDRLKAGRSRGRGRSSPAARHRVSSSEDTGEEEIIEEDYAPYTPGGGGSPGSAGMSNRSRTMSGMGSSSRFSGITDSAKEVVPGFVVVLEGSTPHHGELSFLYPPEVSTKRHQWGFFNRLRNLGKTDAQIIKEEQRFLEPQSSEGARSNRSVRKEPNQPPRPSGSEKRSDEVAVSSSDVTDANANTRAEALPFETYIDPDPKAVVESYFDISRKGWLSSQSTGTDQVVLPEDIGILREEPEEDVMSALAGPSRPSSSGSRNTVSRRTLQMPDVYVDCVTLEPITDTYVLDEEGEIKVDNNNQPIVQHHDYWFQIRFKVRLKDGNED